MSAVVPHYRCAPSDMDILFHEISVEANHRGLIHKSLGQLGEDELVFLESSLINTKRPHLLLAAGFHGEEPAGCWGLLEFLRLAPDDLFDRAAISIIPAVNPSGLRLGQRRNMWGENPNRGFCPSSTDQLDPSREGVLLLRALPRLLQAGRDGFISLHEDNEMSTFYIFTFEHSEVPDRFSFELRDTEERFFPRMADGVIEDSYVKDGIVFRECDGSFEDRLFHEGVPKTACTETPGLQSIETRVTANRELAETFVKHF